MENTNGRSPGAAVSLSGCGGAVGAPTFIIQNSVSAGGDTGGAAGEALKCSCTERISFRARRLVARLSTRCRANNALNDAGDAADAASMRNKGAPAVANEHEARLFCDRRVIV